MNVRMMLACGLLMLLAAAPASALRIEQVQWGFDGQVVPQSFNLLSIQVHNHTPHPYQGALRVRKSVFGERAGIEVAEPLYLSPGAVRWVQFVVVVHSAQDSFTVSWGPLSREEIPSPRLGRPAAVMIGGLGAGGVRQGVRQFPAELFPSTLAATDGLRAVLLDETPPWDAPRRTVLLDWVRGGGTLHLLRGATGHPRFEGDWAPLDQPLERYRVGAGLVIRHDLTRYDLDDAAAQRLQVDVRPYDASGDMYRNEQTQVLAGLRGIVQPKHNWALLYWLGAAYLGLIGPLNLVLARRRVKVRHTVTVMAASVAVFGLLFFAIGRRGYDEQSTIHTLSYARPLAGDLHDVTQWSNIFVTRGSQYQITHDSIDSAYSTWFDREAVRGMALNGRQGAMMLDMPLYSSRELIHRGRMRGHDLSLQVVQWDDASELDLVLQAEEGFPPAEALAGMWVRQGNSVAPLRMGSDGLLRSRSEERTTPHRQFGQNEHYYGWGYYGHVPALDKLTERLIVWSLGGQQALESREREQAAGTDAARDSGRNSGGGGGGEAVELFIVAKAPPGMSIVTEGLGREEGYVLYHLHLYKE
jgi:hypothetical protein